jgi:hypothetical protein
MLVLCIQGEAEHRVVEIKAGRVGGYMSSYTAGPGVEVDVEGSVNDDSFAQLPLDGQT